ncbi:hypothetical protein M5K25_020760 [Dendrobium thyrsiflorum]|uniref:PsbP C-terminal domain-containing protein n=1 Tax=Dendrobium thyrsiflorum TaxID=117978 RepID=A0ABD0UAP4_DENTH
MNARSRRSPQVGDKSIQRRCRGMITVARYQHGYGVGHRLQESTKYAELITVAERLDHGGRPLYEFEYTVDSTRGGMKRIFSAAFVASKKLYLLNISYTDRPESPLDSDTRTVLEQILHSFDSTV